MLRAENLVRDYPVRGTDAVVHAVQDVSFSVERGETLGIVGESGCGKSTTARLVALLEEPTSGRIFLDGAEVTGLKGKRLRLLRRRVQMVFQDPYSSLNPRLRIGDALAEVLRVHGLAAGGERSARVTELLEMVGLRESHAARYPHEFSGGQRQRIAIARALAAEPDVLVLDEAVSALDVSVRAEIMNLLTRLRSELGLTFIFISHDLGMVRHISDRIAAMYLGKVVELGAWRSVSDDPLHPYVSALLDAVPVPDPDLESQRDIIVLEGEPPDPARPPKGCNFNTRCPLAEEVCFDIEPPLEELRPSHSAACHVRARELKSQEAR
jgi:oligopeptide/dipeptide ABC transporter ATP-binding protein